MRGTGFLAFLVVALLAGGAGLAAGQSQSGSESESSAGGDVGDQSVPKDAIRYEFERIEAVYAAAFQVIAINVTSGSWALEMAGPNETLNVTYGILRFWDDETEATGGEAFLKVEGVNGSRRFLGNSGSWSYWNDTDPASVRTAKLEFASHKQVVNDTVVKDFTPPIFTVHLWRALDANRTLEELLVTTWDDWDAGFTDFWKGRPTQNTWALVPGSLREAGDATVGVQP